MQSEFGSAGRGGDKEERERETESWQCMRCLPVGLSVQGLQQGGRHIDCTKKGICNEVSLNLSISYVKDIF